MTSIKESFDLYHEYNLPTTETCLDIDSLEPTIQSEPNYSIQKISSNCQKKSSRVQAKKKDFGSSSSAYALFFRDMQAIIRKSRSNISFGELSKIISHEWLKLDINMKKEYKRRIQKTKAEQMRALAVCKAATLLNGKADGSE